MTTNITIEQYLRRILTSRVYDVAQRTPLHELPQLTSRLSNKVLVKREDLQPVFSFKLRGAYNRMVNLSSEEKSRGVIAASAGNHAQGVALAAQRLNCAATIVMPRTTPAVKVDAVKSRGAEVCLFGDSYSDAYQHAIEMQRVRGLTFIHPFDDPDVIAGQGTVGMEIHQEYSLRENGPLDAVFVPIGGGGLISGVGCYFNAVMPGVRVIGVQSVESDAMAQSLHSGRKVVLNDVGIFSDGTAVKNVGDETFRLCSEVVDEIVKVDTDEVCAAIKDFFLETRTVLEPSGALALAGLKKYAAGHQGKSFVAIASGANVNFDRLRFIAERAEIGEQREALFAITLRESPGQLRELCAHLGHRNVLELNYRYGDSSDASLLVSVEVANNADSQRLAADLAESGYSLIDMSHNEMAKQHVRYAAGGRSVAIGPWKETVWRIEVPERPGVLQSFLTALPTDWNLSLLHYRHSGGEMGSVLVGVQVPENQASKIDALMQGLRVRQWNETSNDAYRLFM